MRNISGMKIYKQERWLIYMRESISLQVRSIKAIEEGDEVTLNYRFLMSLLSLIQRHFTHQNR